MPDGLRPNGSILDGLFLILRPQKGRNEVSNDEKVHYGPRSHRDPC